METWESRVQRCQMKLWEKSEITQRECVKVQEKMAYDKAKHS